MKTAQMEKQYSVVNNGKKTKKWAFIGWTLLPDLTNIKHTIKGEWAIVKGNDGTLERYNIANIVEEN